MAETLKNIDTYRKADELMRICRSAVRKAQAESRCLGVANVYSIRAYVVAKFPIACSPYGIMLICSVQATEGWKWPITQTSIFAMRYVTPLEVVGQ